MALKESYGGKDWQSWDESVRMTDETALKSCRRTYGSQIRFHYFLQYLFFKQWNSLRAYANRKGIYIVGDIPIYVPLDSADVWSNPELFLLDGERKPQFVAGCPPDSFSADGQRWGNPLYNWDEMKENGYRWWLDRLQAAAKLYDVVRLDHFRGFESYWSIPAKEETAVNGKWEKGPGMDFITAVQKALPELKMIAEDLGYVTPQVRKLQEDSGYPGMKVLQFAFDSRESGDYLPHTYQKNSVCYCGTHDNLTLAQWFSEASSEDVEKAKAYLGLNEEEGFVQGMIRGCMATVSDLCVIMMQDYLELDGSARMNFPGTLSTDNWTWRMGSGAATDELARRIYEMTKRYGRI